ncbi:MAG: hypothetical protein PHI19_06840 [Clostridia bacterium]|nr:hypothetical protein [Clostridia bacterium]
MNFKSLARLVDETRKKLDACQKPEEEFILDESVTYDLHALREQERNLETKVNGCKKQQNELENEIKKYNERAALKDDYITEAEKLQNQLKQVKKDQVIIKKTLSFLKTAKDNLTEKYLGKMNEAFAKYAATVLGASPELGFDIKFNYEVVEDGLRRKPQSFSRGYRDLFDVCAHLALADALYKNEKPFLILDDPFKNLDDEKMKAAKTLLKTLAKEYQIIYLVCHTSRQVFSEK